VTLSGGATIGFDPAALLGPGVPEAAAGDQNQERSCGSNGRPPERSQAAARRDRLLDEKGRARDLTEWRRGALRRSGDRDRM
jgi:hypothetical protein